MTIRFEQCINPACRKPYQVERYSRVFDTAGCCGKIQCPYCAVPRRADPMRAYRTTPLPRHIEDWVSWVYSQE